MTIIAIHITFEYHKTNLKNKRKYKIKLYPDLLPLDQVEFVNLNDFLSDLYKIINNLCEIDYKINHDNLENIINEVLDVNNDVINDNYFDWNIILYTKTRTKYNFKYV